ncbi:acyl-CoA N-acyltransferase [Legionella busanensis]|uniref:Acyl-CoA N-acyltransferase n=1 Tax=Legionella busanensis TaxID=190655 RepID=A0A378JM11_9GAMM|nr:GNAT family N-acetyltransferase [Legionella busanensis]STX51781.1 acyl-CoA N-acyltransferase [Legionella busanensis]
MKKSNKNLLPTLIPATLEDYPIIQNMARFYVYDLSRECGFISKDWACPEDGLYKSYDFKNYFIKANRCAYLIQVDNELAGFALLNQEGFFTDTTWNMGEFFILAKFQNKGISCVIASQLWRQHQGRWEVSVIPENKRALPFWRKCISRYTHEQYKETIEKIDYDPYQPKRYIFRFNTAMHTQIEEHQGNSDYKIEFVDKLDENLEQHMLKDLIAYEFKHGIYVNYKPFSLVLYHKNKIPCGVIKAFTAFAEIYIDDIWVDSTYRGKGYGRALIEALENQFSDKGFNNINLCTSAFQAPEFYKKCGFTEEFTQINKINPKLSKTFFVKFFTNKKQTQGLIT